MNIAKKAAVALTVAGIATGPPPVPRSPTRVPTPRP
jgi:hypothetical protein